MGKIHHLVNIHGDKIFSMGCKKFYNQRTSEGFRHCSHIEIVDCKNCIKNHDKKIKRGENLMSLRSAKDATPESIEKLARLNLDQSVKIKNLEAKREKLLGLLLLTDPAVGHVEVGETQLTQHQAFLKAFPDERELLEIIKSER